MMGSNKKKHWYKGLDENMHGYGGYQYEIGKEYEAETDDNYHWLHFAKHISTAINYGPRIVEIEPITKVMYDGHVEKCNEQTNAKVIKIIRELTRDEIINILLEEKWRPHDGSRFWELQPTVDELLEFQRRKLLKHTGINTIILIIRRCEYLTIEELFKLFPSKTCQSYLESHLEREEEE